MSTEKKKVTTGVSYWQVFRLIFVVFSFYLLGDALYRWNGFRYYASFTEFLPSVALITTLWSIVAVFISVLVWMSFAVIEQLCFRKGLKIKIEHLLVFSACSILLGVTAWLSKPYFFKHVFSLQVELIVLLCVILVSILLTWWIRNKAVRWISIIQNSITIWVWLFGLFVVLSAPFVAYHMQFSGPNEVMLQETKQLSNSNKVRPNIILVTFDGMTTRNMSAYGYHRPTTPFINKWAKKASLFTRLEAVSNYTKPTVASLMTGKRVWTHQIYHSEQRSMPVKIKTENLALLLRNHGYFNIAIRASSEASEGALKEFFDIYPLWTEFSSPETLTEHIGNFLFELFGNEIILYDWFVKEDFIVSILLDKVSMDSSSISKRPNLAFNKLLEILDHTTPTPYFAWIHLYPPHFPFLPTEPYMGMFDSSSELRTAQTQGKLLNKTTNEFRFTSEMQPMIDTLMARYDEYIRYCDSQFKEFVAKLDVKNKLKDTIIILSSDHGESFDHDHLLQGGPYLFESSTNIPLIIKEYGQTKGRIINELVEQIDIPATILDLANINIPSWMEGRSVVPLLRDNELPSKPIFSMNFENNKGLGYRITEGTIVVWRGDYKLIYYLDTEKSLLFNLKQDPDELNNLRDKEPEKSQYLLSLIQDVLYNANERISKGE